MRAITRPLFILSILFIGGLYSCTNRGEEKSDENAVNEKPEKSPEYNFSEEEKQFSVTHYSTAIQAIKAIQKREFDKLETYVIEEFLPPQGFDSLKFMQNMADYLQDKDLPAAASVKMTIGTNDYMGNAIAFKTYDFPFVQLENNDTVGQTSLVITFADGIELNKIANISFRDY